MSMKVTKEQFVSLCDELLRVIAQTGESVLIIDETGEPILEVRPYASREHDPLDVLRGTLLHYDEPLAPVGAEDWEALR